MPSSPTEHRPDATDVAAIAQRLCGATVVAAEPCGGGGNNRVFRVETTRGTFAVKCYGSAELDNRDRLGHEFDGLHFLKAAGIGSVLPTALAVDRGARCALYEWIDGDPVADHGTADITAVLSLLAALHKARRRAHAAALPTATEAVLQLSDLRDQIERRVARFESVAPSEPELALFLREEMRPEITRQFARLEEWDVHAPLAPALRTLSPSDFGFHNALRRRDGSLAFIDFEYFGWDDPVKLTADFLWHPAMRLSLEERSEFVRGTTVIYGADASFAPRLALCFPLYGLRWALIILNEFLPELWARRAFAGKSGDRDSAKRDQLSKARAKVAALRAEGPLG